MPSYRIVIDINGSRPGVLPDQVLPAAEAMLGRTHRVEDRSVELVGRQPQINLRFLIESSHAQAEDAQAEAVVRRLVADLDEVAECGGWVLKRGPGRRWRPIRWS
ncbi:hypothetical protein [Parenemella sanctibonifatiensis]|uniref:Uncharacterized protein n=1 Tax=Parenemella sanctibonifatiensis TaxID=2016505 RepID=A0A255EGS6_9ACTN|nr:hypothetical protein [Parenemella sanctibonifatiensis]OYN88582.1 hypothetical protein CGZ91_13305 [Parenemella sanctibonifatiensis]OYN88805.1 hypothetical protein CGZ92_03625 [Parenemella sanctibonifatiensis]